MIALQRVDLQEGAALQLGQVLKYKGEGDRRTPKREQLEQSQKRQTTK